MATSLDSTALRSTRLSVSNLKIFGEERTCKVFLAMFDFIRDAARVYVLTLCSQNQCDL